MILNHPSINLSPNITMLCWIANRFRRDCSFRVGLLCWSSHLQIRILLIPRTPRAFPLRRLVISPYFQRTHAHSSLASLVVSPLLVSSFILNESRKFLATEPKSFLSGKTDSYLQPSLLEPTSAPFLGVGLLNRPLVAPSPVPEWRDETCEVGTLLATLRQLHVFSGSWVDSLFWLAT